MIKLKTTATYYNKKNFLKQSIVNQSTFYNISEAIETFKTLQPRYYINYKDISIIETIDLIYNQEIGIKRYYKTIDPTTGNIDSNYSDIEIL